MNVRPDQLASVISKTLYPVYMVSGDEPLQQMEALDAIRAFLREQDFCEREVLDVDAQFDWYRLSEEAASMSLFASRRIVELRLPSAKPGKQGGQALRDYLAQPPDDTVLLINAGKLDSNSKKAAWFKAVEQSGMVVQCWPVPLEKLGPWLAQRFLKRDMQAEADVLAYISQHVEGNLLAADQEIEKLCLLLSPGRVGYADVVEAISSQSRFTVFELADMMLKGEQARVLRIIAGLKAEGIALPVITWALARDIRLLVQVSQNPSAMSMTLQRANVWSSRQALFKHCLSRHQPGVFKLMLKRMAYIDAASKGMVDANVWDEVESLCVKVAGCSQ